MRTTSTPFLIALGATIQQVIATGWIDAGSFSCPSNTNNRCNKDQEQGYQWNGLQTGDFDTYGGLDFSGFQCVDSFDKRDLLTARTFSGKCIKAPVGKHAHSGPKISCDSSKSFSISKFRISSSEDTDIDFIYGYNNGDVCKHTASCSKGGSIIKNSQCGGATSVTFQLPTHSKHEGCDVGIHSVDFDCGPPVTPPKSSSTPTSSPSASISSSSLPVSSPSLSITYSIPKGNFSTPVGTGTTPSTTPVNIPGTSVTTPVKIPGTSVTIPVSSSVTIPPTPGSSTPVKIPGTSVTTPVASSVTIPLTTGSSIPPVNGTYVHSPRPSSSVSTQELVTTEVVHSTVTTCPVTNTVTSGTTEIVKTSSTISTIYSTSISTICTKCVAPPAPTPTGTTQEVVTTEVVHSTVTTCPVTNTVTSGTTEIVKTSSTISTIYSTSISTICTKCVAPPAPTPTGTTQEVVTTVITTAVITVCPVTQTLTTAGSQSVSTGVTTSTIFSTITSTICTKCVAPPATPVPTSPEASSIPSSPPVPAPAPHILPKCLNTWITLTKCKDNADSDCYCKDSRFTKNVQDCVCSWTEDSSTIQAALSYLAGICAPHVSENPGVITHVPKTITLVPIPAATPLPTAPPASIPVTTISIVKTLTVPCTYTTGPSAGSIIPSSSTTSVLSTAVTVPQVKFTTESPIAGSTGVPNVGLAAGSPAPAPAVVTPTYAPGGAVSPYGPTGGTTFSTGAFHTGQLPVTPTVAFKGGAGRTGTGIAGVLVAGLIGFLVAA